jgi:fluoride exporter
VNDVGVRILLVMAGGGIGAVSRYGTTLLAAKLFGTSFPWGTLIVNLVGCFLIGLSFALVERSFIMNPSMRLFFITGFLGALTTFSTFGYETVYAMKASDYWIAAANIVSNNLVGIALVFLGLWAGRIR